MDKRTLYFGVNSTLKIKIVFEKGPVNCKQKFRNLHEIGKILYLPILSYLDRKKRTPLI